MHLNWSCRPSVPFQFRVDEKCFPFILQYRKISNSRHRRCRRFLYRNAKCAREKNGDRRRKIRRYMIVRWRHEKVGAATHPQTHTRAPARSHTYKIHYTVRDSPMKIAHRRFILISSGRQEASARRHCHRILIQRACSRPPVRCVVQRRNRIK